MRDIRNDLRERLASVASRYADEMVRYDEEIQRLHSSHRKALDSLDRERAALQQMLALEESREDAPFSIQANPAVPFRVALADFIITKIHAYGPLSKDQLRQEAESAGYFDEMDGRTFHTTLMNITKGGKLQRLADGRYAHPRPANTLFGLGEVERKGEEMTRLM
jgi:hypothetical protein